MSKIVATVFDKEVKVEHKQNVVALATVLDNAVVKLVVADQNDVVRLYVKAVALDYVIKLAR